MPVTVAMVPCQSMTTAWITDEVLKVIKELREQKIYAVSCVADNASNMQAALLRLPLLGQRCLAHSIQLVVNDAFADPKFSTVWDDCKIVLKDNHIKEPPITRWSGKYLALVDVTSSTKKRTVSGIEVSAYSDFHTVIALLRPYYIATQLLQSDRANLITAAAVVAALLTSKVGTGHQRVLALAAAKRRTLLITDAMVLVCYFHPGVNRGQFAKALKTRIESFLQGPAQTITGDSKWLQDELMELRKAPPVPQDAKDPYTLDQYCKFWTDVHCCPKLSDVIVRLAALNPTEASCERAFSVTKFAFPATRHHSKPDLVQATVCGLTALHALRGAGHALRREQPEIELEHADTAAVTANPTVMPTGLNDRPAAQSYNQEASLRQSTTPCNETRRHAIRVKEEIFGARIGTRIKLSGIEMCGMTEQGGSGVPLKCYP
jgi:hypothetical protein